MTSPHVLKKSDDEDFLVFAAEWLVLPPPALRSRCTGPIALSFLDLWTRLKHPDFFAARAQSQFYVVRTQEADLSAEVPEPDQRLAERARRAMTYRQLQERLADCAWDSRSRSQGTGVTPARPQTSQQRNSDSGHYG